MTYYYINTWRRELSTLVMSDCTRRYDNNNSSFSVNLGLVVVVAVCEGVLSDRRYKQQQLLHLLDTKIRFIFNFTGSNTTSITMTRFASTVVCIMVMASSSWSDALRIPETLNDAVNKETMRIPKLRKLDAERKNVMQKKLAGMAVKPSEVEKRRLVNDDKTNYAVDYSWDQYTDQQEVGFDITNYAVKYTSCATVQTYSDDLALDETIDTVLAAKRFAMFRLCPVNQCSSYSSNGCGSNYGEYLVALDQFLLAMLEYQESRVAGYCDYCQTCATIEAAKRFWTEVYTTRTTALASAQTAYETWYTSYLQTYQNNNNGYQQGDTITAAQQYYQNVRDSNNYANQYVATTNGNSGSSSGSSSSSSSSSSGSTTSAYGSSSSQYQWSNQNMWEYQNTQNRVSSSSNVWSNMGTAGTFYGRPILNGYYDNGEFVQEYGYFNGNGVYISLEGNQIKWDETLWGEEPDGWNEITVDTESCLYKYAGSCYNQYDACMQILQDEDYQTYKAYQAAQSSSNSQYGNQQNAATQQQATLKDFLGCAEVTPVYGGNAYVQQQSAYAQQKQYDCYDGDENCQRYNEYQQKLYYYSQQKSQSRRYFIGPSCGSNGRDISLAVYSDEYCSVLDSSSKVDDVLGYAPYSSSINLMPTECMACLVDEVRESATTGAKQRTFFMRSLRFCSF